MLHENELQKIAHQEDQTYEGGVEELEKDVAFVEELEKDVAVAEKREDEDT